MKDRTGSRRPFCAGALALLLARCGLAFFPPLRRQLTNAGTAARPRSEGGRWITMKLSGDILTRAQEGSAGRTPSSSSGSVVTGGRPTWFKEMLIVKESRVVQGEHELRRMEWSTEDDEVMDEMIVSGQLEDARGYFEEKKATSVPVYRETLRYYWTQTETEVTMGVPVPKALRGVNLHLIVAEDCLQMALVDDPAFGVIAGKFPGQIDPATSGWQLAENPDGSYCVSITLKKVSQPGTHSMWFSCLVNEEPATCMKYKGGSDAYHWNQNLEFMNAFFPIPEGVRGKQVKVIFEKDGGGLTLSYPDGDKEVVLEKQLSGVVSPEECSWVIDEDDQGQRCVCVSMMKRRRSTSESTWWSRLFKEEELESLPKVKALEETKARVEAELAQLQRDFVRKEAVEDVEDEA